MKPISILDWYRILRAHRQWTIFQSFRYALWLARSLVSLLCVAGAVEDRIHDNVLYDQYRQTLRRHAGGCHKARRYTGFRGIGSSSQAESSGGGATHYA